MGDVGIFDLSIHQIWCNPQTLFVFCGGNHDCICMRSVAHAKYSLVQRSTRRSISWRFNFGIFDRSGSSLAIGTATSMIEGIGIGVVDIARFQESLDRTPALTERLFTSRERVSKLHRLPPDLLRKKHSLKL